MTKKEDPDTFDWIELKKQLDAVPHDANKDLPLAKQVRLQELPMDKLKRKMGENPLIPVGSALTTMCLGLGLLSFLKKRSDLSQTMMRGRILAQGFTVTALIGGIIYGFNDPK